MLAPVIVFAYNRVDHLKRTLEGLDKCLLSEKSNLIIVSDGAKNTDVESINLVRDYLNEYKFSSKFLTVELVFNKDNLGLAKNIISHVSEYINKYKKVIVVEDDVIVAPYFLKYMNDALEYYKNNTSIFSIGGLTVPMNLPRNYDCDIIMTQRCSSYCWATWDNRWQKIDWLMRDYNKFRFNFIKRYKFNAWGKDRSQMLDDQMNKRVNSWAIRFDYYMWKFDMFNIIPRYTLANHIGADGTGTHSGEKDSKRNIINGHLWEECSLIRLENIEPNEDIRCEFCKNYDASTYHLIRRFMSNLVITFINRLKNR